MLSYSCEMGHQTPQVSVGEVGPTIIVLWSYSVLHDMARDQCSLYGHTVLQIIVYSC